MTHSTVLVLTRPGQSIEEALAPFDEDISVERYIKHTKADLVRIEREHQQRAAENLTKFLASPPNYDGLRNLAHMRWIISEAPAQAAMSDEDLFEKVIKAKGYYDLDDDGNEWTTYNPKSRWDWYDVGGRWNGGLRSTKEPGEYNIVSLVHLDLDNTEGTYAILTPDGEWHERGKLGWFALASNEQEEDAWMTRWREILLGVPDRNEVTATLVDVHI